MKNVLDKHYRENQNTHFMFNTFSPPPPKSRPVYDNVETCGGARGAINDMTVWRIQVDAG
jgi:hypothetical protein